VTAVHDDVVEEECEDFIVDPELDVEDAVEVKNSTLEDVGEGEITEGFDSEFVGLSEAEAQQIRDQRVSDSLQIYMRQREMEKAKRSGRYIADSTSSGTESSSTEIVATKSSTWATVRNPVVPEIPEEDRPLYWSETMDLHLSNMVRKHCFDFDEVAVEFGAVAEAGTLGLSLSKMVEKITPDACRLRWTQLDARQWSEVDPSGGVGAPVYKVHVQLDSLGKGHGAQPSYQSMASNAAGCMPTYLTPPTQFPSVSDAASDDEEDDSKKALEGLD